MRPRLQPYVPQPATVRAQPATSSAPGAALRLVGRALRGQLIIPNFSRFRDEIGEIFGEAAKLELSWVRRADLRKAGGHGAQSAAETDEGTEAAPAAASGEEIDLTYKLVLKSDDKADVAAVRRAANPELARSGLNVCSVSGQRASFGQSLFKVQLLS